MGRRGKGARPFSVNERNRQIYTPHIAQIARKYSLDPMLLHAVISAESAFNPRARSPKGAMGLMQLMPATARRFGVYNAWDPFANIEGGARYLRWLLDQFKDHRLALAAYNAGEGAVMRYGNRIPPYPETRTYVTRVQRFYTHYQRIN
jgi:soluble lytic murein transglycosylase-like protein